MVRNHVYTSHENWRSKRRKGRKDTVGMREGRKVGSSTGSFVGMIESRWTAERTNHKVKKRSQVTKPSHRKNGTEKARK